MQQIWDQVLKVTSQLVIPDWGALVALIPIGLAALVVLGLAWVLVRLGRAAPPRRGKRPVAPRPPAGVHAPGPSFAPVFAAIGAFLFFYGLILDGLALAFGALALVLTLLYWGAEAMRDYDAIGHSASVPALVVAPTPPPGVHMPGPSFRPILISIAAVVFFYGLVFGGALLAVGIVMLIVAMLGWLSDARAEYRAVERADVTGHLDVGPAPHYPTGTLAAFAILLVIGLAINSGIIPPQGASGGASAEPGASAGPGAEPSAGVGPGGSPGGSASAVPAPSADVAIHAQNIAFDVSDVSVKAGAVFTIAFTNDDPGTPHNVAIHKDSSTGPEVWKGEIFAGVDTRIYNVPALDPGTYAFVCSVHPNMTGTLTAK
ncbi:MAG TPA: cupredoxin domain-containing protein [Candidatus Limnocylindrales bacterium]